MYGDEELRLTPEELYHEYDAKVSLEDAISVYEKCEELLSEGNKMGGKYKQANA
jgi:HEPN domain-containing protein